MALLKPLARDDSAWQAPSSLPHTFPLAIHNYHTVRVLACPKATAGLIFFGLARLWHAWEGQGKEMGGPAALRSPRAGLGEASPVFFDSAELVREHGPSGSNKFSMWLCNWNCLTCFGGDVITDTVILQNNRGKTREQSWAIMWNTKTFVVWVTKSTHIRPPKSLPS